MKSLAHFVCLLLLGTCCVGVGAAADGVSHTSHPVQERNAQEGEDDHVYSSNEVDVKAKITNKMENLPEPGKDCPARAGLVRLKIILHKSGNVTEVTVLRGLGCSYDEASVAAARKFKFTPAVKDGKQVSQYQIFEYQYRGLGSETRNLTTACTRPPTRCLSSTFRDAGRRVMPGVRLLVRPKDSTA